MECERKHYPRTASPTPKLAILPSVNPAIKQKTPMVPATSFSSSSNTGLRAGVDETIMLNEAMYLFISLIMEDAYHDWPISDSEWYQDNQIDDVGIQVRWSRCRREVTSQEKGYEDYSRNWEEENSGMWFEQQRWDWGDVCSSDIVTHYTSARSVQSCRNQD